MNERGEDSLWEGLGLFVLVFCFVFNKENEEEPLIGKLFTNISVADFFPKEALPVLRPLPQAFHISPVPFFWQLPQKKAKRFVPPMQCFNPPTTRGGTASPILW
ncbi:MAG: hypothetical protein AAFR66_02510 [Bacteroidota bacterium]